MAQVINTAAQPSHTLLTVSRISLAIKFLIEGFTDGFNRVRARTPPKIHHKVALYTRYLFFALFFYSSTRTSMACQK